MDTQLIFYSVCSSISIFCQALLIFGYFKVKMMWGHPEILVVWQCISQMILDSHWFTGISLIHAAVSDYCQYIGAFFVFFYYLSWNYIAFLSIEILIKIKNPLKCNYKKRLQVYHFSSQFSGLFAFCLLVSVQNNNGISLVGTCFVQKSSIYEFLVFLPVVLHVPICVIIGIYIFCLERTNRHAKQFRHHNFVALTFAVCWGICAFDQGLSYRKIYIGPQFFRVLVVSLGAPAGFFIFLARMSQKGLFSKLMKTLFPRKKKRCVGA